MEKPYISKEVYEYIQNIYGNIVVNIDDTLQEIFYKAGQQSVAKHIKQLYDKQENNVISSRG